MNKITETITEMWQRAWANPSYVFIGPPESGKTVYFACATDLLQRRANQKEKEKVTVTPFDTPTRRTRDGILSELKQGKWPVKTAVNRQPLEFEVRSPRLRIGDNGLMESTDKLLCLDYSGEAFLAAFGDSREVTDGTWIAAGVNLKSDIKKARGLFILIDAPKFDDAADARYHDQLFSLFKFIETEAHCPRIAIIFSKMDIFKTRDRGRLIERLKGDYLSAYNLLSRLEWKEFFVASVSSAKTDKKGGVVPPKDYKTSDSEGLLEPLIWMLDLSCLRSL